MIKSAKVIRIGVLLVVFGLIMAFILFVPTEEPVQETQEHTDMIDEALSGEFTEKFRSEFASYDGIALFDRAEVVPGQYFAKIYSTVASTEEDKVRQAAVNKLGSMAATHYYTNFRERVDLNEVRIYGSDGKDLGYTFPDLRLSANP